MFIATLPVLILHLFLVPAMAQGFLSCGVEKCLDRGTWYGCPAYHRPCICQKDMHYIEEFLDKIRPCVEHNANCTEGGMHEYMNGLQLICAEFGHQISRDDEKDNGLSVGATVGIVLGAGLGGTALAGLLFFWWRKSHQKTTTREPSANLPEPREDPRPKSEVVPPPTYAHYVAELDATSHRRTV
ncbi:hypothetical protein BDV95DRAFT_8734 [Massariosphaeria phaeospora]|uniref:Extracellular membrane protein CFEM domain-containing protein n=1 Tax=Massariosphaeria phaeospora TaxID=100035 RepID=A0A7C8IF20_9PLEO|nr:hypothetical protein BDV95DRAFT_8734 [Massariosphaeria phaeospora]